MFLFSYLLNSSKGGETHSLKISDLNSEQLWAKTQLEYLWCYIINIYGIQTEEWISAAYTGKQRTTVTAHFFKRSSSVSEFCPGLKKQTKKKPRINVLNQANKLRSEL